MRARPATADETREWDRLMRETARPHLLQSTGWAEVKSATGWRAERFVFEDGAARVGCVQVLRKRLVGGLDMAYAPRGPLVEDERLPGAIVALRKAIGRGMTVSLLCDPEAAESDVLAKALEPEGIRRPPASVQPRPQREAAVLPAQVALADADERARRSPLRHVGSGRGRRAFRRGELQAWLRRRGNAMDRRARDAGHGVPVSALEVCRAAAARGSERVSEAGAEAPPGWDDAAVRSPGGHVLQSAAWAKIRQAQGWEVEFCQLGSPLPVALILWRPLLTRRRFGYVPRGPIIGDDAQVLGALERIAALARERR